MIVININQRTMKKVLSLFALLLSVVFCSCDEPMDGDWSPIEVDKQQLEFTSAGGEQAVKMLNYGHWWINGGYEGVAQVNGTSEYVNYVHPEPGEFYSLDGGWYRVAVPDGEDRNVAMVVVDSNDTGESRQAKIIMTVGDAFATISVNQQ